ncbi:unnamed protein product [Adineta steineri]|uniref:Uncharacterized protein n=1 Tax=Adineta steineri TaxID=433720 RepID=A0A814UAZ7_9BILA|nr:unnamed protein product [Adineta steineri]CAF1393654.1 unnamed protein product [Adineta steineri]
MSIKTDDPNIFSLIWFGSLSDKTLSKIKFVNKFENFDLLKEYLNEMKDSSVILIVSNNIPLDRISLTDFPQICAIYNDKFVCLYCLPTMILPVHTYIQNIQDEQSKKKTSSYFFPLIRKYWFIIGLFLVIFLAYLFPNIGKTGGYIRSEWSIKIGCVLIIFFLSGLSLRTRQLVKEILHIRLHLFVQIYSLLIIPFTIYAFGLLLIKLSLNKTLIVGIIIMASTSTTISSNVVMTKNALGNEYAALLNAVLGNILGIFISPALILYFLKNPIFDSLSNTSNSDNQLDYSRIIKNLALTVLIPLCIGQIIHLLWTKKVTYLREKFYFSDLNSLALLILVWAVFSNAFATGAFETIHKKDLLILIFINAGIYLFFSLLIIILSRLPIPFWQFSQKDTVAIMFCGATKTLAMGIPLINALYGNANKDLSGILSLPLIIYHVEQLIIGAIFVILLKNWVKKGIKKQNIKLKNQDDLEAVESQTINIESSK